MKPKFSMVIIAKFEKKLEFFSRKIDIRYQINLLTSDYLSFFFHFFTESHTEIFFILLIDLLYDEKRLDPLLSLLLY